MTARETHQAIETVFRIERARLIAGLVRLVRDVSLAEDLAQDALLAALSEWPKTGTPDKPSAWLMTAAKRKAIDRFRREKMMAAKHAEIGGALDHITTAAVEDLEAAMNDDIGDELLSLIFTACHPVLSAQSRAALTLRLICGLTTQEIARAFLTGEATIAQRITRAKKTIGESDLSYEVPHGEERDERLGSVLEVVYLIFNEGYAATTGDELTRPALCAEAQRLGRILAHLMPEEPEVLGLLALVELQASRLGARQAADGMPIPLPEQNRARWDRLAIGRGLEALKRAQALGGPTGSYALQAALAACHAKARTSAETDWRTIAALYGVLRTVMPSPIVDLNRAIAHSMAFGPDEGLRLLNEIEDDPVLQGYAPLAAARGDFLFRAGRLDEARAQFERAAALTGNEKEKAFFLKRIASCRKETPLDGEAKP